MLKPSLNREMLWCPASQPDILFGIIKYFQNFDFGLTKQISFRYYAAECPNIIPYVAIILTVQLYAKD